MKAIPDLLHEISQLAQKRPLSTKENDRLARDLAIIGVRLGSGSYEINSFSDNALNLVERNRDFFSELQFYSRVGRTWSRLFQELGVERYPDCIDLCAGYFPKVELGLHYLNFQGKVRVFNKDGEALASLREFLLFLDIKFPVVTSQVDIFHEILEPSALVVANHIIDDLVIDTFSQEFGLSTGEVYASEENLRSFWRRVSSEAPRFKRKVVEQLAPMIEKTVLPGGSLLLIQYPSYTERSLELHEAIQFNADLCENLSETLVQRGFARDKELASRALHGFSGMFQAEHCYVVKRIS